MPAQGVVEMNPPREIGVVKVGEGRVGKALGEGGVAVGAAGLGAHPRHLAEDRGIRLQSATGAGL